MPSSTSRFFKVCDYDLASTLESGQAFRWDRHGRGFQGVVGSHWFGLEGDAEGIQARSAVPLSDWRPLADFLQVGVELQPILSTFPRDPALERAVGQFRGLRLLRQPPWECLASFILSSTKRIAQIRQVVSRLCQRFGTPVQVPVGIPPQWSFPAPERIARLSEEDLRGCGMGFRAPYLLATARQVSSGGVELEQLASFGVDGARAALLDLPGVGPKIADCVLLFAYDFPTAFPIDVWVEKALRMLYFPRRKPSTPRLREFARTHFGPYAGYAQQYLFHSIRTRPDTLVQP